jgi:xanthine dehydrogenase YagS FAD-binding subunit
VASLADSDGVKLLGGGTNLVDLMKLDVERPAALVDVSRLPLAEITVTDDGSMEIGATVRNSELAGHPEVRRRLPVLSEAVVAGASGQLRNMATTAGNLLQRTRCVYFMDVTKPCNKRVPGSGCPAQAGYHRNLAVLGGSPSCVATHPSDMAVAMAALDARIVLRSATGERTVTTDELYVLPGDAPEIETTLGPGELVTRVLVPALPADAASTYRKVRDRASFEFAVVSVAAVLVTADGVVTDVRIALGGVAPRPWRARTAEARIIGGPPTREAFERAMDEEMSAAVPLPGNAFKVRLASRLVAGTLAELAVGEGS